MLASVEPLLTAQRSSRAAHDDDIAPLVTVKADNQTTQQAMPAIQTRHGLSQWYHGYLPWKTAHQIQYHHTLVLGR
jgi:hypothetical protein